MEKDERSLRINFSNSTRRGGYEYRVQNYTTGDSDGVKRAVSLDDITVSFDNYTQDDVDIYKHSYRPDSKDKFLVKPDGGLTSRVPLSDLVSISNPPKNISAAGYVEFVLHVKPKDDEKEVHEVLDTPIEVILEKDGVKVDSVCIPRQI